MLPTRSSLLRGRVGGRCLRCCRLRMGAGPRKAAQRGGAGANGGQHSTGLQKQCRLTLITACAGARHFLAPCGQGRARRPWEDLISSTAKSRFHTWARAAEMASVIICGNVTQPGTEKADCVLQAHILGLGHHPRGPNVPESPLSWDQVTEGH